MQARGSSKSKFTAFSDATEALWLNPSLISAVHSPDLRLNLQHDGLSIKARCHR
eukprot:m.17090 g.17090  ORF g.17090 m.17090 type:complete len:54 (-) comp10645_c1_seq1:601-762(-)